MPEAKWTQGEWELVSHPPLEWMQGRFSIRSSEAPGGICTTIGGLGSEEEANAKLFLAAPDLLRALKESLKFFNNHRHYEVGEDVYQQALKAIQKAEATT